MWAACAVTSVITRARAISSGTISLFSGLSAPIAAMKVPGRTSSGPRNGALADVQVSIEQKHMFQIEHMAQRFELDPPLLAAADDGGDARLRTGKMTRRNRSRRAGTLDSDFDRVDERDRRAGRGVEQQDGTLDRRKSVGRAVVREIGV